MISFNRVILTGGLVNEVNYRESSNGKSFCFFSILIPSRSKKESEDIVVDVICFGRTAEKLHKYTHKGFRMLIEGRLHVSRFKDNLGNPREKLDVVCERVQFLSRPRDSVDWCDSPETTQR